MFSLNYVSSPYPDSKYSNTFLHRIWVRTLGFLFCVKWKWEYIHPVLVVVVVIVVVVCSFTPVRV